jgi:two-component system, NarL family, nitrate/nitrite response regulator NarL
MKEETSVSLVKEEQAPEVTDKNTTAKMIRIMLADDHPVVREGLRKLIELEDDLQVVAEAADGREVLEAIKDIKPDIVLLDLKMPGMDGLAVLQTLQHLKTVSKTIVLTASEDKNEWVQAMKMGCCGIVVKQTDPELILKSIRKVYGGEIWLDSHTTAAVMRQFAAPGEGGGTGRGGRSRSPLSNREREIVALVAQGYRNREMAEKMFISEQTVKNHLHNIFDKLGVSDRLELALYAIHKGLHLNADQP